MRFASIVVIFLVTLCNVSKANEMPNTEQFMSMLTTCAAGSKSEFEGDLIGSIRDIYNGERTSGFAKLKTSTEFMSLLPEEQKLEGYRIYIECIKAIMNDPEAAKAIVQEEFLAGYRQETPVEKIREVFGAPAKIGRDGTLWFEGAEVDFFWIPNAAGEPEAVGLYAKGDPSKARIPYLSMGQTIEGNELSFYATGDFKLRYMAEICSDTVASGHARFAYLVSEVCYFGKPGGYMNYEFVYQPTFSDDCDDNFIDSKKYSELKCESSLDLQPTFVMIYFNEETMKPGTSSDIMEWIYNF